MPDKMSFYHEVLLLSLLDKKEAIAKQKSHRPYKKEVIT